MRVSRKGILQKNDLKLKMKAPKKEIERNYAWHTDQKTGEDAADSFSEGISNQRVSSEGDPAILVNSSFSDGQQSFQKEKKNSKDPGVISLAPSRNW